jgi:pyruvate dehydrogenase (quinone)
LRHLIDRAMRIARDRRSVTCVILPNDVQDLPAVDTPPREHGGVHSGVGHAAPAGVPGGADLKRVAELLNAGQRVAMLVGAGALAAIDEVIEVAQLLGAGIAKALLGKAVAPDELPYCTGAIGVLGSKPSWDLMEQCDTLLMVGSSFPYAEFLPKEGQARGVQIDVDGRRLSLRYPMEVNLVGDSAATLRALIPLLQRKTDRRWRERVERDVARWWRVLEARAMNEAQPISPQRVFWELSPRLPENCIGPTSPTPTTPRCWAWAACAWTGRSRWARRGTAPLRRIGRCCSRWSPTPRCRRCRRMCTPSRRAPTSARWPRAIARRSGC